MDIHYGGKCINQVLYRKQHAVCGILNNATVAVPLQIFNIMKTAKAGRGMEWISATYNLMWTPKMKPYIHVFLSKKIRFHFWCHDQII